MPMQCARLPIVLLGLVVAACAGNGDGLDQNGNPITPGESSSGAVSPDLQSIQANVFTPICSKCHIGASAPEGLQLDAAHAYDDLVDVPSTEVPSLLRVKPGDPDNSYLVQKIEGAPGIEGSQMPLGETPLPAATIAAIRQWITDGAPNVPGASAAVAAAFALKHTSPAARSMASGPLRTLLVAFTRPLDVTLVNETTVRLERLADASVEEALSGATALERSQPVPAQRTLAEHNPAVLLIRPLVPLTAGRYRLTLRGTGAAALADLDAITLGTDAVVEFSVKAP